MLQYLSHKFASKHRISIERLVSGNGLANVSVYTSCSLLFCFLHYDRESASLIEVIHHMFIAVRANTANILICDYII